MCVRERVVNASSVRLAHRPASPRAKISVFFALSRITLRSCRFVWAPLNYPVAQDEDDFTASSESGFSIASCTEDEVYSFNKTERYALAMFDAGPCYVWRRGPQPQDPAAPRRFKRTPLSICLSENTFRAVDPDQPIELFVTSVPHGPPLAEPRVMHVYDTPVSLPVN
ncbi:hypothetical protein EI94DRAFT_1751690 [Lactarius quietus]|nr:hypothetical protein EI94DRAFT_1751690 [Lactarius quietus]